MSGVYDHGDKVNPLRDKSPKQAKREAEKGVYDHGDQVNPVRDKMKKYGKW